MQEPYWWYVLYVRPNTEQRVAEHFRLAFMRKQLPYELEAFCPETERYYTNKRLPNGRMYMRRPMFPCCVFVETNIPSKEFEKAFADTINNSDEIIRLLRYGGSGDIALKQEERQRFEYLFKGKRCLEHSIGCINGDKVTIMAGPLIGFEGSIRKINRHKRTAQVEVELFGNKQLINFALEIIEKC